MATKNLIQKYADTLAAMEKDAAQNFQQAQCDFQQMQEERRQADAELKSLKDTMKKNHRGFYGAAKAIIEMTLKRPETPVEIDQALEPVIAYQEALAAVPSAEESCSEAKKAEAAAQGEMFLAQDTITVIRRLRCLSDIEEG